MEDLKTIKQNIMDILQAEGLLVRSEDGKVYVMVDGRLCILHTLYPNDNVYINVEILRDDEEMLVTKHTVKWERKDANGNTVCVKQASDISAVRKQSNNPYERGNPYEVCSTSSLGRALKVVGILSQFGVSWEEMKKSGVVKIKDNSVVK